LLYAKVPHATIKARTIATIPIVNQKSRWRPVPGAAFHDLLGCPIRCWMPRHLSVGDFSVGVPNHKENVKRFERIVRTQKKSQAQMSGAWRFRNSRQPGFGPRLCQARIYFVTVLAETLNPNLANSAWIRFWPHSVFSVDMRLVRA
jgi:hypothetical protein